MKERKKQNKERRKPPYLSFSKLKTEEPIKEESIS